MQTKPKIVLVGGGTGSFTLLQGLKRLTPNLTAIVNMSDDAGSSGVLRDELGVLPPGDIRQCLVALSDTTEVRDLFNYRFPEGRFEGQSLGNIILAGLELQHGSFENAVDVVSHILHITGQVIPITLARHLLILIDGDEVIRGESNISTYTIKYPPAIIKHEPEVTLNPKAKKAIVDAEVIIIAPGNLYCSLLPNLAVNGIKELFKNSKAKVMSVVNLINKPGQTDGWHVVDYITGLERYIGKGRIDIALYNTAPISKKLLSKYAADGEYPVLTDAEKFSGIKTRVIGADLVAREMTTKQDPNDVIKRTFIRHDALAVCEEIIEALSIS